MPSMSRNSFVVFVTGNGSAGTGRPSRSQIGSQPSPGVHSSNRLAGTPVRTASLWRTNASIIAVGFSKSSLKRSWNSFFIDAIHTPSSPGMWSIVKKIVFDALRYHDSGSRPDGGASASGNAAESSGQNEPPGQSTIARYFASIADQSTG